MMKIFKHEGKGHYIGSCVIVVANTIDEAKTLIRDELDAGGLPEEKLKIEEIKFKNLSVIHSINGDY